MGNTLPKLHQIIEIVYNNGPNATHGKIITLSDAYHEPIEWFFHHMNNLVLFQDLLDHVFIDHCSTSKDHPQAYGLVKRMVQTCRKGLRKICLTGNKEDWDRAQPYIAMGYRMSKHASLSHFTPYFLLFGRHPIPPFSIVAQIDQVVDLDSLATWAWVIAEKVVLFRRVMPRPWRTCPLHIIETPYNM